MTDPFAGILADERCTGCGHLPSDHVKLFDRPSRRTLIFCLHAVGWNGGIMCYHRSITNEHGDSSRVASACDVMRPVWGV